MERLLQGPVSRERIGSAFPDRVETKGEPAIVITDSRGLVVSVNSTFETATGYSRYKIIGKNVADLKHGTPDATLYQAIAAVISRGEYGLGPWRPTDAVIEGRMVQVVPLCDQLGVISNFMAIRHAAPFPPARDDGAKNSYRGVRIARLAAGIAHNFNNLLTVITGWVDLLLARPDVDPHHRRKLKEIRDAAEKAAGITRKLLAFGREQVLVPETVNLKAVVREVLDALPPRLGEGVELRGNLASDTGWIHADPAQIEWILSVLADTACRNMPAGGRLTVTTTNLDLETSFVRQHVLVRRGRYVMLSVHDTGENTKTETGPRVFEPFLDTLEDPPGLSLAAVYGTVRQSGGYIWVFSSPGKGTAFKIYFPRVEGP